MCNSEVLGVAYIGARCATWCEPHSERQMNSTSLSLVGRVRHLVATATLALLPAVVGCAASSDETDADSVDNAITHAEASKDYKVKEHVIIDEPATNASNETLGITTWNAYAIAEDKLLGLVAYASNADGDVRYAVIVDLRSRRASMLVYDKSGLSEDQKISEETATALASDFKRLDKRLSDAAPSETGLHTQALGNKTKCGLYVAGIAVGAAAVGAFGFFGGMNLILLLEGSEALAVATGIGMGGSMAFSTGVLAEIGTDVVTKAVNTCKAAANGE